MRRGDNQGLSSRQNSAVKTLFDACGAVNDDIIKILIQFIDDCAEGLRADAVLREQLCEGSRYRLSRFSSVSAPFQSAFFCHNVADIINMRFSADNATSRFFKPISRPPAQRKRRRAPRQCEVGL
jgi:hypothetical protein